MNLKIATFLTLFIGFIPLLHSQEKHPTFIFDGVLKNKFEYLPDSDESRFSVRNARLRLSGEIIPLIDYRAQVDLSREGKFQVLDLFATFHLWENISFTLGQTKVPFFNSFIPHPGKMMFANRTFVAKYFAGTRDIGAVAKYQTDFGTIPMAFEVGIFNGSTINNPVWKNRLTYAMRLTLGDTMGFRSIFKIHDYSNLPNQHYFLYGIEARYASRHWKIESEAVWRKDKIAKKNLFGSYLQGAYCFPIDGRLFKSIIPALRWDTVDQSDNDTPFDVHRCTLGFGLGLTEKPFSSLLRFDYEWYSIKTELPDLFRTPQMDADKFTVELVLNF